MNKKSILETELQISINSIKIFVDDVEKNLSKSIENINSKMINDVFDKVFYDIEKIDIVELMIINLHKAIEKLVTKIAKSFEANNKLYRYNEIKKVLLKNDIDIIKLNNFKSYRELVSVSNKIKHGSLSSFWNKRFYELLNNKEFINSTEVKDDIYFPKELISKSSINYESIQSFYERIKSESFLFIEELIKKLLEIKKAQ